MLKGMTFVQAHDFDQPAFWAGEHEEFMLDAATGIVQWHPWRDEEPHHPHGWDPAPEGTPIPQTGWFHMPPDDCEFCRSRVADL